MIYYIDRYLINVFGLMVLGNVNYIFLQNKHAMVIYRDR